MLSLQLLCKDIANAMPRTWKGMGAALTETARMLVFAAVGGPKCTSTPGYHGQLDGCDVQSVLMGTGLMIQADEFSLQANAFKQRSHECGCSRGD